MKSNKLLSIVIPVYKVEKYIRQCLDSVIVSTDLMEKLEVIVVNDGTPDNSAKIAHEYANRYPDTICVIDKENGGHGSAWNVGLKMATGKYIRFLDSDDWLSNLSDFIPCIEDVDSDIIFTNIIRFYEDTGEKKILKIQNVSYYSIYKNNDFSYINTHNVYDIYNFHYCTYRTSLLQLENPLFVEKVSYDDGILFVAPLLLCKSLIFFDMTFYNYRLGREGQSMERSVELTHTADYIKVCAKMIDFANNHLNINDNQKEQRDMMLYTYMKSRCSLFSNLPYKLYRERMSELLFLVKKAPYIKLSPKMRFYNLVPSSISWGCFQLFNKFVLPIINR